MRTVYEIVKFSRPKKKELSIIDCFSEYNRYDITDEDECESGEYIRLFRADDSYMENLVDSRFAVQMELPQMVTDYEKLYLALGFAEESVKKRHIHFVRSNGWDTYCSDGVQTKQYSIYDLQNYEKKVIKKCIAIKMETLWISSEEYVYPDRDRVNQFIPDIDKYRYVPINNRILAKAEIPFLIYERNRGKCLIEKY
ncbi:MAG: hypothetical protein LUC98_03080 [Lachnospiraceae bacterium]|nr:hypothetical protein [Lachnospiraceae bacterium]